MPIKIQVVTLFSPVGEEKAWERTLLGLVSGKHANHFGKWLLLSVPEASLFWTTTLAQSLKNTGHTQRIGDGFQTASAL